MMTDKQFFRQHQELILGMANTDYGRDLLCIPKDFPKIARIGPNHIDAILGNDGKELSCVSDFRTAPKWANVIRHKWDQFQSYAKYFQKEDSMREFPISPLVSSASLCYNSTTFFPTGASVDGYVTWQGAQNSWATVRAAAGTAFDSTSGANGIIIQINSGTSSSNWTQIARSITGFDTSSLGSTATISAAVISIFGTSSLSTLGSQSVVLVKPSPASNTALANSDYNIGNWTMTDYGTGRIATGSWSTIAYNDFTMTSAGRALIQKTGVTNLGFALSGDADNTEPTFGVSQIASAGGNGSETAGTSSDPKLVVTFTLSVASPGARLLLGIG